MIKIAVFFSAQIHEVILNFDFDILAGAVSTALHHTSTVEETLAVLSTLTGLPKTPPSEDVVKFVVYLDFK